MIGFILIVVVVLIYIRTSNSLHSRDDVYSVSNVVFKKNNYVKLPKHYEMPVEGCYTNVETVLYRLEDKYQISSILKRRIKNEFDTRGINRKGQNVLKLFPISDITSVYGSIWKYCVPFNYIREDVEIKESVLEDSYTICNFRDAWDCNTELSRIQGDMLSILQHDPNSLLELIKKTWLEDIEGTLFIGAKFKTDNKYKTYSYYIYYRRKYE